MSPSLQRAELCPGCHRLFPTSTVNLHLETCPSLKEKTKKSGRQDMCVFRFSPLSATNPKMARRRRRNLIAQQNSKSTESTAVGGEHCQPAKCPHFIKKVQEEILKHPNYSRLNKGVRFAFEIACVNNLSWNTIKNNAWSRRLWYYLYLN